MSVEVDLLNHLNLLNVHSKCDLGRGPGLNVSAKTGEGLDELKRAIVAKLEERMDSISEAETSNTDVAALREAQLILDSQSPIPNPQSLNPNPQDLVLLANAVRAVAERLGAAIGATYSSDLLDNLFSRFCVGK